MFQYTFRLNVKAAVCCAAALGLLAFTALALRPPERKPAASAADAAAGTAEAPTVRRHIAFLSSLGWRVSQEPPAVRSVEIPAAFGAVYERYNRLQLAQGFDLAPYRGRTVKTYEYGILAYPGEADGTVRANVLEYGGQVIGGDISSVRIDGFMHGFRGETNGYDPT